MSTYSWIPVTINNLTLSFVMGVTVFPSSRGFAKLYILVYLEYEAPFD